MRPVKHYDYASIPFNKMKVGEKKVLKRSTDANAVNAIRVKVSKIVKETYKFKKFTVSSRNNKITLIRKR